jgi:hypothetical protein
MAMYYEDNSIKCDCGTIQFEKRSASTYKKDKDRTGECLKQGNTFEFLVCMNCGKKHSIDLKRERIVQTEI